MEGGVTSLLSSPLSLCHSLCPHLLVNQIVGRVYGMEGRDVALASRSLRVPHSTSTQLRPEGRATPVTEGGGAGHLLIHVVLCSEATEAKAVSVGSGTD